jgi:subtilase family serine protease
MHRTIARAGRDSLVGPAGRRRRVRAVLAAAACTATLVVAPGAAGAFAAPVRPTPSGAGSPDGTGIPGWASNATKTGPLAPTSGVSLAVVLNGHNDANAEATATAISSPTSAGYRKFITAATYRQRYAATTAEAAAVTNWLRGAGFTVSSAPANHLWIRVTGTAATVRKAFGTTLDGYTMNGQKLHAPATPASVPAAVRPYVAGIAGLSSSMRFNRPKGNPGDRGDLPGNTVVSSSGGSGRGSVSPGHLGSAPPPAVFVNAPPCSAYYGQKLATTTPRAFGAIQPYVPCGYVPAQLRGAYGLDKLKVTGSGVRVAVLDAYASPTATKDVNTYATKHGGKAFRKGQFTQVTPKKYRYGYSDKVNGDKCGEQGWYGEQTLDLEAVHGIAPGAKVVYVAAASCNDPDLLEGLNTVVDDERADIVSNSWGEAGEPDPVADAALLKAYKKVFIQAACEGIGVFFSSGDNGDETNGNAKGTPTADFPASSPWVTAVGGTSLAVGAKNDYQFEAGWGTGTSTLSKGAWSPAPSGAYLYGGGGGPSHVFKQPSYQRHVVPDSDAQKLGGDAARVVPDIAAVGDPQTGMLIGQTQTFPDKSARYSEYRIGGTSLAAPVTAAIVALADQATGRHGFATPAIYDLAGTRAVHDVVPVKDRGLVRVNFTNSVDAKNGTQIILRTFQQYGTLGTREGYDNVTGVGTPNGYLFVYGLGQSGDRAEAYAASRSGLRG